MDILAQIAAYFLIALFIIGGIGFIGYMVAVCRASFSRKSLGPLPWWIFWRR